MIQATKGLGVVTLLAMLLLAVICVWAHFDPSMMALCDALKSIALAGIGATITTFILSSVWTLK